MIVVIVIWNWIAIVFVIITVKSLVSWLEFKVEQNVYNCESVSRSSGLVIAL